VIRLYYASDIHGSEQLWRKFLAAASFYDAGVLIMGGDMSGKLLVPLVETATGVWEAKVFGRDQKVKGENAAAELEKRIRFNGFYPYRCDPSEMELLRADTQHQDRTFKRVMAEELERWLAMAHERLGRSDVRVYVMPGNDDPWEFDEVLARAPAPVENVEGRVVRLEGVQMLSSGWSNPTPWDSPREKTEEDLLETFEKLREDLEPDVPAIFNLHVPPYDSQLDLAAQIDDDLKIVSSGGSPVVIPVGSRAVREVIEEYQPLLALHGHIHESRGLTTIGRTTVLNPGSEYNNGTIHGAVVALAEDRVVTRQLVVG
jgi:uncharacterized protein